MNGSVAPVRRSPLASVHARLGARFADAAEWPVTYGDLERERRATREAVALVDTGPLDKISIDVASGTSALGAPGRVTRTTIDGRDVAVWTLTDDQAIVMAPGRDATSSGALAAALEVRGFASTDVSSGFALLELVGPRARDLLEEVLPLDLRPGSLEDGAIAFGPLAHVTVAIARVDRDGQPGFAVLVERDQAEYLWDALAEIGAAHGVVPAGTAALAED